MAQKNAEKEALIKKLLAKSKMNFDCCGSSCKGGKTISVATTK